MEHQPTINIGVIGHVSHGKTTLVGKLTSKDTKGFEKEQKMNKTIKLGYANAKIYKCDICIPPLCYSSCDSSIYEKLCEYCNKETKLVSHVSFVDCPGHNDFISAMLNGTSVMDTTIGVISVNSETIPEVQTHKHFVIANKINILPEVICANKIDLLTRNETEKKINDINEYIKTTYNKTIPLIPISASMNINTHYICEYLATQIKPKRKKEKAISKMMVIRSFNINKPHITIDKLCGGVIGGSIIEGEFCVGDSVIVYPGFHVKNNTDKTKFKYQPIKSKILSINSEKNKLDKAMSGGLIGVQLTIDSGFTTQDKLSGCMLFREKPKDHFVYEILLIEYTFIDEFNIEDKKLHKKEKIFINCNAKNISCTITQVKNKKQKAELELDTPICSTKGDKFTISRNIHGTPTLIAIGTVIDGIESECI